MRTPVTSRPFWGRPSHRLATPGLRVYESRYLPGDQLRRHAHEKAHFCYVVEGAYAESLAGRGYERQPGTLIYYPPHTAHAEQHHAAGRHLLIELEPDWWEVAAGTRGPASTVAASAGQAPQIAEACLSALQADGLLAGLTIEGLALELGAVITCPAAGRGGASDHWLRAVRDLLEARFREPITLSEVAAYAGVHPAHLVKAFRRRFGCGIGAHLRRLRVADAIRRLRESDEPLATIAVEVGFADQSHLTRVLKAHTLTTPGALRRCVRK